MQTSVCPQCHKPFAYYPSNPKRYCSRACQSATARAWTTCPACGKEFWYHKSWPRIYCSRKCSASVNGKRNFGKYAEGETLDLICEQCGKPFRRGEGATKITTHHFCSQRCWGDYLSHTTQGVPRPELRGEKPHLQNRVDKVCPQCGKTFRVKESSAHRRIFCCKACRNQWMEATGAMSGANSPRWQGGPEPYYGPNWRSQRRNARRRDGYRCRNCGVSEDQLGCQLDVHHIRPFRNFGLELYDEANKLSNLISLCKGCHALATNGVLALPC